MASLIRDLVSVLAQTFWFFAMKYQTYDFRQMDGRVIRVIVSEVVPELMEVDMPEYVENVS